jgi:hypothetical protein
MTYCEWRGWLTVIRVIPDLQPRLGKFGTLNEDSLVIDS